ncbi:MAG: ISKra4 family transposase [Pseudomonadota bacterium]
MQAHALALENPQVTAPSPFSLADEKYDAIKTHLASIEARGMTHSELERLLQVEGRELMRRLLQDHLTLRAQQERELGVDGPVVGADGVVRTDLRDGERALMTVFGGVRVERVAHHTPGMTSLRPLDAALNLPPESFSLGVQQRAAVEATRGSFDDAVESIVTTTGAKISKRQLEDLVVRAATDFDAFYQMRGNLSPGVVAELGEILVLTTDGKGVVMRLEALREATRRAALRKVHKLKRRLAKGEKKDRKRMAQVAAVYTIAPFPRTPEDVVSELDRREDTAKMRRPRPEHKRVWASLSLDAAEVIGAAFEEAARRDPEHKKIWVALSDGNEDQLCILEQFAMQYDVKLTIVLDVIHVLEYLWKASLAFNKEGTPEAEEWVSERFLPLLRGKARDVAAGIRRSATLRKLRATKRKAADKCADYLLKYAEYLHYDEYLAKGLPIATGVIEGACRHLIKDRMDITGARWGLDRGEAILRLRSIRSSGDWQEYWAFHECEELARNHAEKYANGEIPAMRVPVQRATGRPHLWVVK